MNDNRDEPFWPWLLSGVGCLAVSGYFWKEGDGVTAVAVIVLTLSTMTGYNMKASRLFCLDCGLAAAALLVFLTSFFRATLTAWLGTSGSVAIVSLASVFVAFKVTAALLRYIAEHGDRRQSLEAVNRWAGLGLGASQGAILCALVLGGLLVLEPIARQRLAAAGRDNKIAKVITERVVDYAGKTRASAIGPTVAKYNPFRHCSPLKQATGDVQFLRKPWTRAPSRTERAVQEHFSARN